MSFCIEKSRWGWAREAGQATVEAAFALPVLFAMFALLLQPAVLLYDRCVMDAAAAETCRLAATQSCSDSAMKAFVLRRLDALPSLDLFHTRACDWEVEIEGGAQSTVSIKGHVTPLPLLGITASTMTDPAGDGCALLSSKVSSTLQPSWLSEVEGGPGDWVAQWD